MSCIETRTMTFAVYECDVNNGLHYIKDFTITPKDLNAWYASYWGSGSARAVPGINVCPYSVAWNMLKKIYGFDSHGYNVQWNDNLYMSGAISVGRGQIGWHLKRVL